LTIGAVQKWSLVHSCDEAQEEYGISVIKIAMFAFRCSRASGAVFSRQAGACPPARGKSCGSEWKVSRRNRDSNELEKKAILLTFEQRDYLWLHFRFLNPDLFLIYLPRIHNSNKKWRQKKWTLASAL
jgi:hypothetical protein